LSNPNFFPIAYQASIAEIKRRLIFNDKITKEFDKVNLLVVKENEIRKKFIYEYGKYLTHDYVPHLKFADLAIKIEYDNNNEMDNLPDILEDDDYESTQQQGSSSYQNTQNNNEGDNDTDTLNLVRQGNSQGNSNVDRADYSKFKEFRDTHAKRIEELDNKNKDLQDMINNLNVSLESKNIAYVNKDKENSKLLLKVEKNMKHIQSLDNIIQNLNERISKMNDNFMNKLTEKNKRLKEKVQENENLQKSFKFDCIMCKESLLNSCQYQSISALNKDLNEKINEKNKLNSEMDDRFEDQVKQYIAIKRIYFNYFNITVSFILQ